MNIGILEILVILLIIVFIFGGNRLPDLGRGLGRGIRNFKEANRGTEQTLDDDSKISNTPRDPLSIKISKKWYGELSGNIITFFKCCDVQLNFIL